jgi:hypothetical protein
MTEKGFLRLFTSPSDIQISKIIHSSQEQICQRLSGRYPGDRIFYRMGIWQPVNEGRKIIPQGLIGAAVFSGPFRPFRRARQKDIMAFPLKGQGQGQHGLHITA